MGRKRKDDSLGLPPRVYARHGAFYYVHPEGRWERLGTDLAVAKARGQLYNEPGGDYGTVAYWYKMFLADCRRRVGLSKKHRGISHRTLEDYSDAAAALIAYFGKMLPEHVQSHHVASFLDAGSAANRAVRANREKAALSSCFTWLKRQPAANLNGPNPCFGVARNPESKRDRYVEHEEYAAVYRRATKPVRILMDFVYRTLQRPEDIIKWTAGNIIMKRDVVSGQLHRVLRNVQDKTSAVVDIGLSAEIEAILEQGKMGDAMPGPGVTFIRTRTGRPFTYSGLSAMFRRYVSAAVKAGEIQESFTMYDLKGKGATDMWLSGVPLEQIQVLCGHDSVTTTETYVKCRWRGTVLPNATKLSA